MAKWSAGMDVESVALTCVDSGIPQPRPSCGSSSVTRRLSLSGSPFVHAMVWKSLSERLVPNKVLVNSKCFIRSRFGAGSHSLSGHLYRVLNHRRGVSANFRIARYSGTTKAGTQLSICSLPVFRLIAALNAIRSCSHPGHCRIPPIEHVWDRHMTADYVQGRL
jgi:hypothetical protein